MKKELLYLPLLLFVALLLGCKQNEKTTEKAPNIVLILADDLGYGDISSFNKDGKINTPHVDQLAENGVMFTDAHTTSSVCTPTRYGILTGRYNWRSKLKNGVLSGFSKALIEPDRLTLPAFLKQQGYTTAYLGKWHLGWDWALKGDSTNIDNISTSFNVDYSKPVKNGPNTRGFDYSFGFSGSLDMAPYIWVENDMPTMIPTKKTVDKGHQTWWREGETSDDFVHDEVLQTITTKTVTFIEQNAEKEEPFFVYMPLPAPHTPILPSPEFKGKSGLDNIYGDFVMMVDDVVGQVMASLEEKGIAENTIVIFTSDNGCSPQADFKQLATKEHNPNYVFRGHKADIFEGGHRVPFVLHWPAKVKPGESSDLVCTSDFYATFADVLDAHIPDHAAEDSYSFLHSLGLKSQTEKRTSIVHHSINGSFAYRKGKYKTIFCPGSGGWSYPTPNSEVVKELPPVQLYNLEEDIEEMNNLQNEYPEIIEQHRTELSKIVNEGRSTSGTPQPNNGEKVWKQLHWMKN